METITVRFNIVRRDNLPITEDLATELQNRAPGPLWSLTITDPGNGIKRVSFDSNNPEVIKRLSINLRPDYICEDYMEEIGPGKGITAL